MHLTLSWCWKTIECKKYHEWDPREGDQMLKRERDGVLHIWSCGELWIAFKVCVCVVASSQLTWLMKEGDVDDGDEEEELIMNLRNEEDIHTCIPENTKALLRSTYAYLNEKVFVVSSIMYIRLCCTRIEEVCPFERMMKLLLYLSLGGCFAVLV